MASILPFDLGDFGKPQIGLVNETCSIQRMAAALTDEPRMSQALQLVIHERHDSVEGLMITSGECSKLRRDLGIRFHFDTSDQS
jgi:hypothetical protein